jgi:hypothetical protein
MADFIPIGRFSRRAALKGLAAAAVPIAGAQAEPAKDPDARIAAAIDEIEAALKEKHPDLHVQASEGEIRRPRIGADREVVHETFSHGVLVVACRDRNDKGRWFVDDGCPLLADDVTGTTAFADWEKGHRG